MNPEKERNENKYMDSLTDRNKIRNNNGPKIVEIKPVIGCRPRLVAVKASIIYAFGIKGQGIKSLAAQHGCTWDEIEAILREPLGSRGMAA